MEIIASGTLEGHKDAVYALISGSVPNIVFSSGGDGMVVRWDLDKKGEEALMAQLPNAVYSLLYFKETNILLAGARFGGLYILDLSTHKQLKQVELAGDVFDLLHIPQKHMIMAACAGGYLYLISDETFEIIEEIHPTDKHCRVLALSPDGYHMASGWSDGKIRIYDTDGFRELDCFSAHDPSVFSLVYLGDGKKLVSGGRDAQLRVWNTELGYIEEKKIPAHMYTINNIILVQEYGLMATASRDKTVKIWEAGKQDLMKVIDRTKMPAHSHSVNKLLWTGYKDYLLSAGDDKIIRIWGVVV